MTASSSAKKAAARLEANLAALDAQWRFPLSLADDAAADGAVRSDAASGPGGVETVAIRGEDGEWRRVHSARAPLEEARRWLERERPSAAMSSLVCVIGAGLGWIVDVLESTTAKILVLEPEPALARRMLARRDFRGLIASGRLMLLTGPSYTGAADAWRLVDDPDVEPLVLAHPVIGVARPAAGIEAARVVKRLVADARANANARQRFEGRYLLNTLRNLAPAIESPDVGVLFDRFRDVPAIICGAGPSLDAAIARLRHVDALETRALIIAADTALRPLAAAGLRPHLTVSLDPSELNGRHFEDLPDCSGSWLVAEPSVDPRAFAAFEGQTLVFRVGDQDPWPWLAAAGVRRSTLESWGSVITAACDLAIRLGCRPVLLAGLDLAYTSDRPYARGTSFERGWAQYAAWGGVLPQHWTTVSTAPHLIEAIDVHGRAVRTPPHLPLVRDWLRSRFARPGAATAINITDAGILHGPAIAQGTPDSMERWLARPGAVDPALIARAARADDRRGRIVTLPSVPSAWSTLTVDGGDAIGERAVRLVAEYTTSGRQRSRSVARSAAVAIEAPLVTGPLAPLPERLATLRALLGGEPVPDWARVTISDIDVDLQRTAVLVQRLLTEATPIATGLDLAVWRAAWNAAQTPVLALCAWAPAIRPLVDAVAAASWALIARDADRLGAAPSGRTAAEARGATYQPAVADLDPGRSDAAARRLVAAEWLQTLSFAAACRIDPRDDASEDWQRWMGAFVWHMRCAALDTPRPVLAESPDEPSPTSTQVTLIIGDWRSESFAMGAPPVAADPVAMRADAVLYHPRSPSVSPDLTLIVGAGAGLAPSVAPRLAIAFRDRVEADGAEVLGWKAPIDLSAAGAGLAFRTAALDDGRALVTVFDGRHSLIVDEDGGVSPLPAWPIAIHGEAPWRGGTLAWAFGLDGAPHRVVYRSQGQPIVEELPFWPMNFALTPEGDTIWASRSGGVWAWSPEQGARQLADGPAARWVTRDGEGYRFELIEPKDPPAAASLAGVWRPGDTQVRAIERDAAGEVWSRAIRGPWTARAEPQRHRVVLAHRGDASGVASVAIRQPHVVAWAGGSLVVVTAKRRVWLYRRLVDVLGSDWTQ